MSVSFCKLTRYITQESHELDLKSRASSVVTNSVSWRSQNIFYKKNELFLDVVESLNILQNADGSIIRSEINGKINVNAFLSGMPILKLGLNDQIKRDAETRNGTAKGKRSKYINMQDVKFHQCVELDEFEKTRTIQFIPPDGKFELMSYRIADFSAKPLFQVSCDIDVKSRSRVIVAVKASSHFKKRSVGNNVEIYIPVPPDADSPRFKAQSGTVVYAPEHNAIVWKIKSFPGAKEFTMKAELQLSSIEQQEDGPEKPLGKSSTSLNSPIQVKFEIPYLAVSGIQVRYLKVTEPKLKYQSLPWVRYLTQNGDEYSIRLPAK
jgi:AP-1 complex subunit mu